MMYLLDHRMRHCIIHSLEVKLLSEKPSAGERFTIHSKTPGFAKGALTKKSVLDGAANTLKLPGVESVRSNSRYRRSSLTFFRLICITSTLQIPRRLLKRPLKPSRSSTKQENSNGYDQRLLIYMDFLIGSTVWPF